MMACLRCGAVNGAVHAVAVGQRFENECPDCSEQTGVMRRVREAVPGWLRLVPPVNEVEAVQPECWHVAGEGGEVDGPFTLDELIEHRDQGTLGLDTWVHCTGWSRWERLEDVDELYSPGQPSHVRLVWPQPEDDAEPVPRAVARGRRAVDVWAGVARRWPLVGRPLLGRGESTSAGEQEFEWSEGFMSAGESWAAERVREVASACARLLRELSARSMAVLTGPGQAARAAALRSGVDLVNLAILCLYAGAAGAFASLWALGV